MTSLQMNNMTDLAPSALGLWLKTYPCQAKANFMSVVTRTASEGLSLKLCGR